MNKSSSNGSTFDELPHRTLLEIATQYATPAYAFDQRRIRFQAEKLKTYLPDAVEILYSLKANASLGISEVLAECGLGADVASAGELVTAVEAGFSPQRIFMAGPYKSPEAISLLRSMPEAIISIDSRSELMLLASEELPNRAVIRLRPDFDSKAVVVAGPDCRFGVPPEELPQCKEEIVASGLNVIGFHIFAGSQVLDAAGVIGHMQGAINLSLRAADILGISLDFINLGGGFGIPYKSDEEELWLAPVGEELDSLMQKVAPARMALELGRYLVAQAGWYLTKVVGHQTHQGRLAVIVDGGTHQRADMCGLGLRTQADPPLVLDVPPSTLTPTDVLGCLSLPADVMSESCLLPPLSPGNVLAFANAGAYGMWSSPAMFHAYPLPAEFAFDGTTIEVMRPPQSARSILDGQNHVTRKEITVDTP